MKLYRDCGSEIFNTGTSKCPFEPEFIDKIILTPKDMELSVEELETEIVKLTHANRPDRLYAIGPIGEYAPSGGEAQTTKNGYGASKITSYSELVEKWTMQNYDMGLYNNLLGLKNEIMRAMYIDRNGVLYCEQSKVGKVRGYELSAVYPSGARFKTSGASAALEVNLVYKDVERAWINSTMIMLDQSVADELTGLVWVDVKKIGSSGTNYKVVEHYGAFDATEMYGTLLGKSEAWSNVTTASYNAADGTLSLTATSGQEPKLKSPADLLTAGIKGIEQWS